MLLLLVSVCGAQPGPASAPAEGALPPPRPADPYYDRQIGTRAMDDGIYNQASQFFLRYREATQFAEPAFADATILLVESYLHDGKAAAAAAALAYHDAHSSGLRDPRYADALTYWGGAVLLRRNEWAAAAAKVKPLTTVSRVPEYRNLALELLGDAYVRLERWQDAEAAFLQLLREFPESGNALRARFGLVNIYLATAQATRAEQVLAEIQTQHADAPQVTLDRCRVLIALQEKRLDDAYRIYGTLVDERPRRPDPDWWIVVSQLADGLMAAARHEDAVTVWPQAAELAPSESERARCRLRETEALIALEKVMLAINSLETFRKTFPDRPEVVTVQMKLAGLLRRTNNHITASQHFTEVAANQNALPELRCRAALESGWCYREAGQYENAVKAFAEAAALAAKLGRPNREQAEGLFLAGDTAFSVADYATAALHCRAVADNYPGTEFAEEARLRQARALGRSKLYESAAGVYEQFLNEFPDSGLIADATLEYGIALKNWPQYARAKQVLAGFAAKYPGNPHAVRALMEGYQAAMGDGDVAQALRMLSTVISEHADSDLYAHAIHQRAYVHRYRGSDQAFLEDCRLFLEKYETLPMATDVLIWLGDYYVTKGDLAEGERQFMRLVNTHYKAPEAPSALYDAAKSAYERDDLTRARFLLGQFDASYLGAKADEGYPTASTLIQAQCEMLKGDILAKEGKYDEALPRFAKARELGGDRPQGIAAEGRLGEMCYSLGGEDSANLEQALRHFTAVVQNPAAPPGLVELAKYRQGKTLEKLGRLEEAIAAYLEVYYGYEVLLGTGKVRDWLYFARSGYAAADLLVMQGKYRRAARIYERLAESGIPTADEALAKARQIRDTHDLNE